MEVNPSNDMGIGHCLKAASFLGLGHSPGLSPGKGVFPESCMKIHSGESSDAAAEPLVAADFPRHEQWVRIVREPTTR